MAKMAEEVDAKMSGNLGPRICRVISGHIGYAI
jgi:hypothetical protein